MGSIPESGRSPGGGNGNPLLYSCLENPIERGARLQSIGWQRVRHDWAHTRMHARAHTHTHTHTHTSEGPNSILLTRTEQYRQWKDTWVSSLECYYYVGGCSPTASNLEKDRIYWIYLPANNLQKKTVIRGSNDDIQLILKSLPVSFSEWRRPTVWRCECLLTGANQTLQLLLLLF